MIQQIFKVQLLFIALVTLISCSKNEVDELLNDEVDELLNPTDDNVTTTGIDKSFDPSLDTILVSFTPKVTKGKSNPLYEFSITSNDIDFILSSDPDVFKSLTYVEQARREMPDKRTTSTGLFDEKAYIFKASFKNGKEIGIWCHSSFGNKAAAEDYASKVGPRLGKLPSFQRDMLDHVVIHTGDETAFGETVGRFFVLYSDNMDKRISTNDLEETIFHESIHATIQGLLEDKPEWKAVQRNDNGNFITNYASRLPALEDMPETAIFCYVTIKYPGRLPADVEQWVKDYIPNRLEFFKNLY